MNIKGVNIQNEENYYKILSVIMNREDITIKEVKTLNAFLKGNETKAESINILSENQTETTEDKGFSAIRGLANNELYSFFKLE